MQALYSNFSDFVKNNNIDLSQYKYVYKKLDISNYGNGNVCYSLDIYYVNSGAMYSCDASYSLILKNGINFTSYTGKLFNGKSIDECKRQSDFSTITGSEKFPLDYYYWNGPITYDSTVELSDLCNSSRVDWVTPELQDTFDNKGNLELLPSFDPLASYSMASQQALQELLSNLASSSLAPAQQLDLVNKFITGLKTSETPEPNPNPDPSPEPNPNPDPSNPDNGSDGDSSGDSDIDKGSFVRDLRTLFPFCIPFDLIDCIRLFNAEPVTPKVGIHGAESEHQTEAEVGDYFL